MLWGCYCSQLVTSANFHALISMRGFFLWQLLCLHSNAIVGVSLPASHLVFTNPSVGSSGRNLLRHWAPFKSHHAEFGHLDTYSGSRRGPLVR
ncbi:hypothetical protein EV426DRAFT_589907 [Tirmania nivea]|nr:hypothetical protein EV426DRAFT_589907 [Tirmania nivea]